MKVWKKTANKNYKIEVNGLYYTVIKNKVSGQGFILMVQGTGTTTYATISGTTMVDAVKSASIYIKSL